MTTNHVTASSLVLAACLALGVLLPDTASACPTVDSPTIYPPLPDLPGADIQGEARIVIDLDKCTPLIEVNGRLYTIDRPIDVASDLDYVTVLFVVPSGASVFVTMDGDWTENLDPLSTSRTLAFDMYGGEAEQFGFGIMLPGQEAPTSPTVVIRSHPQNPPPR